MSSATEAHPAADPQVGAPVLVVDDDPGILDIVVLALQFKGYATAAAKNGAEALEEIERQRPSLVLLDMRMPVVDGWAFARELDARGIDVPVVVMTAAQDAQKWAAEIGADDYLEKPFNIDELVQTVERVLDRQ